VSRLRARCPDCRTLTAVALGPEYQCHSCGRGFSAGLVRVEQGPLLEGVGYPEAARVRLGEDDLAALLPERPLVLGGDARMHARVEASLGGAYVVVEGDLAALAPDELDALEERLRGQATGRRVRGAGFPDLSDDPLNGPLVERFARALGL
jgi:hypothetical protein